MTSFACFCRSPIRKILKQRSKKSSPGSCTHTRYSKINDMYRNVHGLLFYSFSGRGQHHIPIPIFQNKFGGIPSHVQSIGFNVCHSVDGRVDLLTGCNKSGADHFTVKHLSIWWWLRQRTTKPVVELFLLTLTLSFLLYSSSSELNHYHSILCPLSISELFMGDVWESDMKLQGHWPTYKTIMSNF